MPEGRILDELPPRNPTGGSTPIGDYDWDAMALLAKENPGKPVLAAEHVRDSRVKSVRGYRRAPFVSAEGRIIINVRNSAIEEDGVRYGDVFFTWEPKETKQKRKGK